MERLKNYLLENEETLKDIVQEINCWNGALDWLDYCENNEYFFNDYFKTTDDAVRAVCYGNYNYNDDYVRFNAYGNLESCDKWEYMEELKSYIDDIIDNLLDNYRNICITDDKIDELIEEIEKEKVRDNYTCTCGNTTDDLGFYPCDENGEEIEPDEDSDWANLYVCAKCKNIINFDEI